MHRVAGTSELELLQGFTQKATPPTLLPSFPPSLRPSLPLSLPPSLPLSTGLPTWTAKENCDLSPTAQTAAPSILVDDLPAKLKKSDDQRGP